MLSCSARIELKVLLVAWALHRFFFGFANGSGQALAPVIG
jgi:hypothetical protein